MTATALKRLRSKLRLSQAELAAEIGVHQTTVQRWETGERPVPGPAKRLLSQLAEQATA